MKKEHDAPLTIDTSGSLESLTEEQLGQVRGGTRWLRPAHHRPGTGPGRSPN